MIKHTAECWQCGAPNVHCQLTLRPFPVLTHSFPHSPAHPPQPACLLQANKSMELEMLEGQGERLRKDNLALQRRLQAALAALATYGSPLAGPGGLAARMAQVSPEAARSFAAHVPISTSADF